MNNIRFTAEHYNSNDGMMTAIWGPCLWHALHTMSFNYPTKPSYPDMIHYFNFFKSLKHVLPCGACRTNYADNLEKLNFGMHCFYNRTAVSLFVYNLHELVNAHLGKTSNLSYDDVRNRFEVFRARCHVEPAKNVHLVSSTIKPDRPSVSINGSTNGSIDGTIGCSNPLVGVKSKCVLSIVPYKKKCNTFNISKACINQSNEL